MGSALQREVLKDLIAERLQKAPLTLLDPNFPQQNNFISDPARLKALFCTRRAAKSYTGGLYLVKECIEHPGVNCLFIGLTRLEAKGIIWKDILKVIDAKHDLKMDFNLSELTATFPNGSMIWITGVDADADEMNKLLGKKYKLVILDEASLYSVNLSMLIYGILKPAVADQRGTICMMGTSSNITKGLFYDITVGKEPGWSLHKWTAFDNPYIAKQWQEELDEIDRLRPLFKKTALFRQWYLNEWVVDDEVKVYRFDSTRNFYNTLPVYSRGAWSYVLGVDLGYHPDPSAFVVVAFHEHDKCLYILESFKKLKMDVTDVANKIKEYQKNFPIYKVIIDGSNKQAVEEMRKRHDVALTAADKRGKADFIELMNAEFIQGNIKLQASKNADLVDEYNSLVWETKNGELVIPRKEHGSLLNHICDAGLYAWRFTFPFLAQPMPEKVNHKDPSAWVKHTEQLMEVQLQRDIDRQAAEDHQADVFAIMDNDPFNEGNPLQFYLNRKKAKR
jgi:phage terminase large subunit